MRYLFLSILVLFATQPLQASFCDMGMDQSSSHQAMSDGDMHAGMGHGNDSDTDQSSEHDSNTHTMDCCDDEPASGEHGCTAMAHCGACPAGLVAVNPTISSSWISTSNGNMPSLSQVPPNQFSSPPFRPPIS